MNLKIRSCYIDITLFVSIHKTPTTLWGTQKPYNITGSYLFIFRAHTSFVHPPYRKTFSYRAARPSEELKTRLRQHNSTFSSGGGDYFLFRHLPRSLRPPPPFCLPVHLSIGRFPFKPRRRRFRIQSRRRPPLRGDSALWLRPLPYIYTRIVTGAIYIGRRDWNVSEIREIRRRACAKMSFSSNLRRPNSIGRFHLAKVDPLTRTNRISAVTGDRNDRDACI